MKPRLTPWIDWPTEPTLPGWYDVRIWTPRGDRTCYTEPMRWRWDGSRFISPGGSAHRITLDDQWRGLAEPPEKEG